jgi:hypothetical protein
VSYRPLAERTSIWLVGRLRDPAEPLAGSVFVLRYGLSRGAEGLRSSRRRPARNRADLDDPLHRDAEEAVRITYVAATRARDLLVLPGVGDLEPGNEILSGWLEVLNPVIYPSSEARRSPGLAPGCPKFGGDSVHERPAECRADTSASVAPGLHSGSHGGSPVVWWEPSVLRLDVQEEVGLRQERILVADEGEIAVAEGVEAYERWQARRLAALESGSEPSMRIETVTALAAGRAETLAEGLPQVTVEKIEVDRRRRPAGRRFGLLVSRGGSQPRISTQKRRRFEHSPRFAVDFSVRTERKLKRLPRPAQRPWRIL